jgi:predicted DCC family thiol-disulfide oxidoreductase YuxK
MHVEIENSVILFDGVCGLCNRLIRFVIVRDRLKQFRFVPLTSDAGQKILGMYESEVHGVDSIVLVENGRVFLKSDAVIRVAMGLGWGWKVLAIFSGLFLRIFRDFAYDFVARHRYRLFGKLDKCELPVE